MTVVTLDQQAVVRARRRHRAVRPQLLTRQQLDRRAGPVKAFDNLVAAIEDDLGGTAALSAIERELVEIFCGAAISVRMLNAEVARGRDVDLAALAAAGGLALKVASRLGIKRRQHDNVSLSDYLASRGNDVQDAAP
jgi:hypothetical protein